MAGEPEGSPRGARGEPSLTRQPWRSRRGRRTEGPVAGSRKSPGSPREAELDEAAVVPRAGAGEPGGLDKQKLSALDLFSPPVTRGNIIGKKRIKSDTSRVPVGGGGTSGGRQTVLGWLSVASELKPAIQSSGVLHLVFTSPRLNCLRSSSPPPPSFVRA